MTGIDAHENVFVRRLLSDGGGFRYDPVMFGSLVTALSKEISPKQKSEFLQIALKMPYQQYLRTIYWGVIRGHLVGENTRCQFCGGRYYLQVHHTEYEHRGEEWAYLSDLQVLCRECHKSKHGLASVGEIQKIYRRRLGVYAEHHLRKDGYLMVLVAALFHWWRK